VLNALIVREAGEELAQFFLSYSSSLISRDPERVLENTSSLMLMGYLLPRQRGAPARDRGHGAGLRAPRRRRAARSLAPRLGRQARHDPVGRRRGGAGRPVIPPAGYRPCRRRLRFLRAPAAMSGGASVPG
jgi:hypothetical protein